MSQVLFEVSWTELGGHQQFHKPGAFLRSPRPTTCFTVKYSLSRLINDDDDDDN